MVYKAAIFDLDGTLVNSLEDLTDAVNQVLSNKSLPTHDVAAIKSFVGTGLRNLIIKSLPEGKRDDSTVDSYLSEMKKIYGQNCTNKTKPYSGIVEMLTDLRANNIPVAVLSNKADNLTKIVVNEIFPQISFSHIIGMTKEETRKPSPYEVLRICADLGVKTDEAVFIGDSDIDMQTAKNAGMFAIGVEWGFRDIENLLENGADMIVLKADAIAEKILKE